MLRYYNQWGKPIEKEDWYKLFSDPANNNELRHDIGPLTVETSWVGVAGGRELDPLIYLVRTYRRFKEPAHLAPAPQQKHPDENEAWFPNLGEALAAHRAIVDQLMSRERVN